MKSLAKLGALSVTVAVLTGCSCGYFPVGVGKMKQDPAPVAQQCEFTLSGDVLLDFEKYNLSTQGRAELDDVAQKLKNCGSNVTVVGYTDRLGSVYYNLNLSQNRANTVVSYLRTQGVTNVNPVGKADQIKACEGYPAPVAVNILQKKKSAYAQTVV